MKNLRLIPLIIPLTVWLLNEIFLWKASFFYLALAFGALLIIFGVKCLVPKEQGFWLPLSIPPLLFFVAFFGYTIIIVDGPWISWTQLISFVIVWFLFFYLRNLYYYYSSTEQPQWAERMDNLLLSGSFLSAFAASAFLFALPAFLNWPFYLFLPSIALVSFLLFSHFRLLPGKGRRSSAFLLLISVLILTELGALFTFLPLNFNILALFFAVFYYLGVAIMRLAGSDNLNRRAVRLPLIFCLIIIFLLLLTARWL